MQEEGNSCGHLVPLSERMLAVGEQQSWEELVHSQAFSLAGCMALAKPPPSARALTSVKWEQHTCPIGSFARLSKLVTQAQKHA